MAHIVVLGGGIGGVTLAYDFHAHLSKDHRITLISDSDKFDFTPSNPWVAVGWRKPEQIQVNLTPHLAAKGIEFIPVGAARVHASENRVELSDGRSVDYDYLVIATGPALAFDEVKGLGPQGGFTQSICKTSHATEAGKAFEAFALNPGPIIVGAAQGASCFGPAYEFAFILDTELRRRRIRDRVPMTFVTPEPYIGHLGLDGVGDTKSLLESELRNRHIAWITNAKLDSIEAGKAHVIEVNEDGAEKKRHDVPFNYGMILPAFRGIPAVQGLEGLVNPRGFILIDEFQRNPRFKNIYAVGVCVAIPPVGKTPLAVGAPKTGYMIETMAAATVENIKDTIEGKEPSHRATWNAICLADFGDSGVAFVALPQIPPRNVNWAAKGKWVHFAKGAFEKYFLTKVKTGMTEPYYERAVLSLLGAHKFKA
ncbi:MAG: FAD-dependent oxidoreductase [Alphaproteobacteria bacterium]